jgi:flagellar motor switch protein FliG
MDKISKRAKSLLVCYVKCLYENRLARIIAILGCDSPEAKEALENKDSLSRKNILDLAKVISMSDKYAIKEVDDILAGFDYDFKNEYNNIKNNLLNIEHDEAKKIIEEFRNELSVMQDKLNDCIFNFNDLQNLNDRAVQILLKELDQQQLAKALKGASTEVQDRIFRNMSKTTANMLKEDLQFIGSLSLSEVDEAQSFILKTLFELEKKGRLKINSLKPSELIK